MCLVKILIRLCKCAGWSKSLLIARSDTIAILIFQQVMFLNGCKFVWMNVTAIDPKWYVIWKYCRPRSDCHFTKKFVKQTHENIFRQKRVGKKCLKFEENLHFVFFRSKAHTHNYTHTDFQCIYISKLSVEFIRKQNLLLRWQIYKNYKGLTLAWGFQFHFKIPWWVIKYWKYFLWPNGGPHIPYWAPTE